MMTISQKIDHPILNYGNYQTLIQTYNNNK